MLQHGLSITLVLSAALATLGLRESTGWLDRVVQYQKAKLFNEVREMAPISINAELRPLPKGYEDSREWNFDSVVRLLTLIRESETAKPVRKALRRMLQPSRRLMMSMKDSLQRFPSIKGEGNNFYYDNDYTSVEDHGYHGYDYPHHMLPEHEAVLVVTNPVEARLPSARISVKLLREILEARARAARHMQTTTHVEPWLEFVRNRTRTSESGNTTETGSDAETTDGAGTDSTDATTGGADSTDAGGETTAAGNDTAGGGDTAAGGEATTAAAAAEEEPEP